MALDQAISYIKDCFPATLGAIIGAWNKRDTSCINFQTFKDVDIIGKLGVISFALFAIVIGISLGKWVSTALIGYYEIPPHAIPIIEFVTALNGIKLVDGTIKTSNKAIDIVTDKVPKIVNTALDAIHNKIKKMFE